MTLGNPWAKHYQSVWRELSQDTATPLWVRVSTVAFACHRRNGHAGFASGELANMLGVSASQLSQAVRAAKERGWLSEQSCARCLVVRPNHIVGGDGFPNAPCPFHDGQRTGLPRVKPSRTAPTVELGVKAGRVCKTPGCEDPVAYRGLCLGCIQLERLDSITGRPTVGAEKNN